MHLHDRAGTLASIIIKSAISIIPTTVRNHSANILSDYCHIDTVFTSSFSVSGVSITMA